MLNELSRQATSQIQDEFRVHDTPKEIDIFCPGTPTVTIKDLMASAESAFIEGGECMVVNLRGENFSFKLRYARPCLVTLPKTVTYLSLDFALSLDLTSDWSFIVLSLNCEEAKRSSFFYDGESNDI